MSLLALIHVWALTRSRPPIKKPSLWVELAEKRLRSEQYADEELFRIELYEPVISAECMVMSGPLVGVRWQRIGTGFQIAALDLYPSGDCRVFVEHLPAPLELDGVSFYTIEAVEQAMIHWSERVHRGYLASDAFREQVYLKDRQELEQWLDDVLNHHNS